MKKSFFYLAAGLMAISACTSEKVLDEGVNSNVIGFQNVVGKQTKAEGSPEVTNENFKEFSVFGYYTPANVTTHGILVFNNVAVNKNAEGNWEYGTPRYWVPGAKYYFYAYSCGGIKLSDTFGKFTMDVTEGSTANRVLKITNYTCDATHQHDLLFAVQEDVEAPKDEDLTAQPVSLQFNHILTKVNAVITSQFPSEYTIQVSDVKISGIRNKGNYNPKDGWKNLSSNDIEDNDPYVVLHDTEKNIAQAKGEYTTINGEGEVATIQVDGSKVETGYAFVLPNSVENTTLAEDEKEEVTISFNIKVNKEDEVILERNLSGSWKPEWKLGYRYTYNIAVTGDAANLKAIVFTTATDENGAVVGWKDETVQGYEGKEESDNKFDLVVSGN